MEELLIPLVMSNIIFVNTRFDKALVTEVKQRLKKVDPKEENIFFRINSYGGNVQAFQVIAGFMYFMYKYKHHTIIGQAVHAESAALMLFLNCKIRQVTHRSVGIIHLPIPNRAVSEGDLEDKRRMAISYILRRTKMTEKEIIELENLPLGAAEMIKYGIATEKVRVF
jgi:ATP-dependent protease ClpP protease subunit